MMTTLLQQTMAHPDRYELAVGAYITCGPLLQTVDPDNTSESLGDFIRRCDALDDETWADLEALSLLF